VWSVIESEEDGEDLTENLASVQYSVEIGEFHERDKVMWVETLELEDEKFKK